MKKKLWLVIFVHWSYAPPATMDSNLGREWTKGATHSPWLRRGYKTSILMQRVWFWASAKLCLLKNNLSGHKSYLSTIDPQPPPPSTYGKKRVGNSSAKVDRSVPQEQTVWYDRESKKNKNKTTHVLGHVGTSRLIGSGPIRPPVRPSKGPSGVLQAIDHSVAGSMTAQPPGIRPSALRVATHGQQVASLGGVLPLCRGAVGVFYSPSRQGERNKSQCYHWDLMMGLSPSCIKLLIFDTSAIAKNVVSKPIEIPWLFFKL